MPFLFLALTSKYLADISLANYYPSFAETGTSSINVSNKSILLATTIRTEYKWKYLCPLVHSSSITSASAWDFQSFLFWSHRRPWWQPCNPDSTILRWLCIFPGLPYPRSVVLGGERLACSLIWHCDRRSCPFSPWRQPLTSTTALNRIYRKHSGSWCCSFPLLCPQLLLSWQWAIFFTYA